MIAAAFKLLLKSLRALGRDRGGNSALIFSLLMPGILIAVGAGIDYGNLTSIKANLQNAADAAVLSGARELRLSNIAAATVQADMTNFALANLKGGNFTATVTPTANLTTRTATVTISAVAPTYINTPINAFADKEGEMYRRWIDGTPMGRLGEPEEVASVVLFLASDAASLMTGAIVLADGGYTCW